MLGLIAMESLLGHLKGHCGYSAVFMLAFWDSKPPFVMSILPKFYPRVCLLKANAKPDDEPVEERREDSGHEAGRISALGEGADVGE